MEYSDGRSNLVATLKGNGSDQVLGFTGHMDCVPTGQIEWEHDPFGAEEVDGKIYGRGACDMKSGLVAATIAMISLKEEGIPLNGDIKLLATVGEETGGIGAKQLTEKGYADELAALVIAEPTKNELKIAHKGALWVEITTYGKTAHGSMPEYGINAILHMNEIINLIQSDHFKLEYDKDDILSDPTYSNNVIQGGSNTNVVPDQCKLNIDFRTLPSQDHKKMLEKLQQVIKLAKQRYPNLKAEINVLNDLSPVKTPADDPFVKTIQQAAESVYGNREEPQGMTGYTDGS